jgi:short-subunit dehydrogenase
MHPTSPRNSAERFGEVLRQELHGCGIDVTEVYPGRIDTPMITNLRFSWVSRKWIPAPWRARSFAVLLSAENASSFLLQANLFNIINFYLPPWRIDWRAIFTSRDGP